MVDGEPGHAREPAATEPRSARRHWVAAAYAVTALAYLLPVWSVQNVPTTDGPLYVYNARILHVLGGNGPSPLKLVFERTPGFDTNRLPQYILSALLRVTSASTAEKLLVTAILTLFFAGAWMLARNDHGRSPAVLLAFAVAYHLPFQMGFDSFCLGVGMALISIAVFRRTTAPNALQVGGIAAAFAVTYLAHPAPAAVALLVAGVVLLFDVRRDGITIAATRMVALLPAALLVLRFMARAGGSGASSGVPLLAKIDDLVLLQFVPALTNRQWVLRSVFALVYVALLLCAVIRWIRAHRATGRWAMAALPVAAIVVTVAYFLAPDASWRGDFLPLRLAIFPPILILGSLTEFSRRESAWKAAITVLLLLHLLNAFELVRAWRTFDQVQRFFAAPLQLAPPGSRITTLTFDRRPPMTFLPLLAHVSSRVAAEHELVDWDNYQAGTEDFPVRFRGGIRRPDIAAMETRPASYDVAGNAAVTDYIYTWRMREDLPLRDRILALYEPVAANGIGVLYRRRLSRR